MLIALAKEDPELEGDADEEESEQKPKGRLKSPLPNQRAYQHIKGEEADARDEVECNGPKKRMLLDRFNLCE